MTLDSELGLSASLGQSIGDLRRTRGWSAAELARRAGIGKATLSEIEAGRRNTTLETLDALTRALGVPLSAPLPDGLPVALPPGDAVSAEVVARFSDAGTVTELYRIGIRAGARGHRAAHAPGLRKVMTVFAGEVTIALTDATLGLAAGQSAQWSADSPHTYSAGDAQDAHAAVLMRYAAAV